MNKANKNLKKYRDRLLSKEKREYLDQLINHFENPGSPCPTGTEGEIVEVTKKFEWYQKEICCQNMAQRDSEILINEICKSCYTTYSNNGSCNCF